MNLYDYILPEFEYDREAASMFCSVFEYREEPKDKLLIKQGNHSHNVIFFENGLARTCYRKGSKDITHFFYGEGTFYLSTEVVFLKRDNIFDIQTLEECRLRVTQFDKLRQLADRNPKIYHFILKEFSRNIRKTNDKIYGLQFNSAKERYLHLINEYPDILQRSPLGHIASYLGITQQRLSNVRREYILDLKKH